MGSPFFVGCGFGLLVQWTISCKAHARYKLWAYLSLRKFLITTANTTISLPCSCGTGLVWSCLSCSQKPWRVSRGPRFQIPTPWQHPICQCSTSLGVRQQQALRTVS